MSSFNFKRLDDVLRIIILSCLEWLTSSKDLLCIPYLYNMGRLIAASKRSPVGHDLGDSRVHVLRDQLAAPAPQPARVVQRQRDARLQGGLLPAHLVYMFLFGK